MARVPPTPLAALPRETLLSVALETMHVGHLLDRALMPHVAIATKSVDVVEDVAIAEWMGASPVYTARMRRLMDIDGDDVGALMKALQLDVGFPHQYMDVGWKLVDSRHGEFWLRHCGALLDVEPHGERRVIGMCHHIEDPTFDATAYATNPRARIRPVHRPPRVPANRAPHCHWTIEIDPESPPIAPAAHTQAIAELPLAAISVAPAAGAAADGWADYRGAFDPEFRLGRLSTPALAAVAREFQAQSHLLSCSAELTLTERLGAPLARELLLKQWVAASWVAAQRLAAALGRSGGGSETVAAVLVLLATLPPGFERTVSVTQDRVRLVLTPESASLLDAEHPGWLGLLARGELAGVEAAAQAVEPRARIVRGEVAGGRIAVELAIDPDTPPAEPPGPVAFMQLSTATAWRFDLARAR
jgi:hypothetical protein